MTDFISLQEQLNRNTKAFLHVDLKTAMTLVQIATESREGSERRERNRQNARNAYETIQRLRAKLELDANEQELMSKKLAVLRGALERLGEKFE